MSFDYSSFFFLLKGNLSNKEAVCINKYINTNDTIIETSKIIIIIIFELIGSNLIVDTSIIDINEASIKIRLCCVHLKLIILLARIIINIV